MKRVPHAREVDQAIRGVLAEVKESLKGVNTAAGQAMMKGDYSTAEALVAKGREVQGFQVEVDAIRKRWKELRGSGFGKTGERKAKTPLWSYFQPILMALVELGGAARRLEIEPIVQRIMAGNMQPGDLDVFAQGETRWQRMIRRSRKQLVEEGWLEGNTGTVWKITRTGRGAAKKPLVNPSADVR